MLHSTLTAPNSAKAASAAALTDAEVGDVDLYREAAHPGAGDLARDRLRRGLVDVGDDDVHARARELRRDGASDAAAASRDHRGPTLERVHL